QQAENPPLILRPRIVSAFRIAGRAQPAAGTRAVEGLAVAGLVARTLRVLLRLRQLARATNAELDRLREGRLMRVVAQRVGLLREWLELRRTLKLHRLRQH